MRKGVEATAKEELLTEFAKELPAIRRALKVSQSELGNRIGLSRQSISSIERGNVAITWNTLLAIMMVVQVNNPVFFKKIIENEKFSSIANFIQLDSELEKA